MDTLRLMLISMLIGATVSTSPTYSSDVLSGANPVIAAAIEYEQQGVQQAALAQQPTPQLVYVTATPTKVAATSAKARTISTGTSIKRELYRGCQGDDVRMLQKLLKDLGYSVSVDGYYGSQTRNAVIAFQRNNGLKADGIAGARTIRRLASDSAIPSGGGVNRTTLRYGMRGQDVLELQYRLAELGYYFDICSGNYLTNTRAGVRWFQQLNGLPIDGIAGPMTLSRLYSSSAIPATQVPPIGPTSPSTGSFYRSLYQGMSGVDVSYLQQLLKDLGYFTGSTTGYFGSATYWAVSTFQAYNGLYSDGIAGSATQRKLVSGTAVPYPGTSPTSAPTPTPTPGAIVTPTPTPTVAPGWPCPHCGQYVEGNDTYKHTTKNVCNTHYLCQTGTDASHSTRIPCGHYKCQEADGTHVIGACGETGHYICLGMNHKLRSCKLHYECKAGDHGTLKCGVHYECDPGATPANHADKCSTCGLLKCAYLIGGSSQVCLAPATDHTWVGIP